MPGSPPNHVWNVVLIDNLWYHVDCSWGAGYLSRRTGDFVFDYSDFYLLCDPEKFIRDHFPLNSRWQLLKTPMSLEVFESQACTKPAFYRFGMTSLNPDKVVLASNGTMSLSFTLATLLDFTCTLFDQSSGNNFSGLVNYTCELGSLKVDMEFPESGRYIFTLYGRGQRHVTDFQSLITFTIIVDNVPDNRRQGVIDDIDDILGCYDALSTSWGWTSHYDSLKLSGNIGCTNLEVKGGQCLLTLTHEPLSPKVYLKATLYNLGLSSKQMRACPNATNITSQNTKSPLRHVHLVLALSLL